MSSTSDLIEWTSFRGIRPRGQRRRDRLEEFIQRLTTFHVAYVKEGVPGFSPTIYCDHYVVETATSSFTVDAPVVWRCGAGVKALTALVLDLDHHAPDLTALERSGNLLILYTTFSNTGDDPRSRLVAPLAAPIAVEHQATLWSAGVERFDRDADPACKDPSRFYFVHSAPPDRAQLAEVRILDGELWAPESLATEAIPEVRGDLRERARTAPTDTALIPLGWAARDFIEHGAPIGEQRRRALSATRNLLTCGTSIEDTIDAIWQGLSGSFQEPGKRPWTRADAEFIVTDLERREPPPLALLTHPRHLRLRDVARMELSV